jgi:hypothetical protein|tara:strand:+ start:953 stop:1201 length:249 start_codon:yes stop_codon:yes gene_type:complete
MSKVYVIRYKSDYNDDHTCVEKDAVVTNQKEFICEREALHFMGECSVPIRNIFVISSNCVSRDITLEQLVQAQQEHDYVSGL